MIIHPFLAPDEADLEIGSRAEGAAVVARHDGAAHAVVGVDEGEGALQLGHHGGREGIALSGPVQGQDDDGRGVGGGGRVVREFDLGEGEGGVGGWKMGCHDFLFFFLFFPFRWERRDGLDVVPVELCWWDNG